MINSSLSPTPVSTCLNNEEPVADNADQTAPTTSVSPSARKAAERMRESRSRKRKGLRDTEISEMVRRGLLDAGKRADGNAIIEALHQHLDATLKAPTP